MKLGRFLLIVLAFAAPPAISTLRLELRLHEIEQAIKELQRSHETPPTQYDDEELYFLHVCGTDTECEQLDRARF